MNISQLSGQAAAVLALVATIPYVLSILKGKTQPNRASWLIWWLVNLSLVASYHYAGATTTIWLNIAYVFTTGIIFFLSLKYGVGGYTKLDTFCLAVAAIGLILWWMTNNPVTALYLNILVDALGFIPTLRKAYLHPASEDKLAWNLSVISNALNVMALTSWQLKIIAFPIYNFTFNAFTALLLYGIPQRFGMIRVWKARSK